MMLVRRELEFKSGAILRKEMLEEMYHFPRMQMDVFYSKHSDGILFGLNIQKDNKILKTIFPGALKFQGKIYIQEQELDLKQELSDKALEDQEYYLCFKQGKSEEGSSVREYPLELGLEESIAENSFPMRKVMYRLGDFYDVCDKPDTGDEILGVYSSKDGFGYSLPMDRVVMEVEPILKEKGIAKGFLDYILLRMFCEEESLSLSFINLYLEEYNQTLSDKKRELIYKSQNPVDVLEAFKDAVKCFKLSCGNGVLMPDEKNDVPDEEAEEPDTLWE